MIYIRNSFSRMCYIRMQEEESIEIICIKLIGLRDLIKTGEKLLYVCWSFNHHFNPPRGHSHSINYIYMHIYMHSNILNYMRTIFHCGMNIIGCCSILRFAACARREIIITPLKTFDEKVYK